MLFENDDTVYPDGTSDLFAKVSHNVFLLNQQQAAFQAVQELDREILLASERDVLSQELDQRYHVNVPVLLDPEIHEPEEVLLDVADDPLLSHRYPYPPAPIPHIRFVVDCAFQGDASLFHIIPSRSWTPPLRGIVSEQALHLVFSFRHPDQEQLQSRVYTQIARVKESLETLRGDVHAYNETLLRFFREQVKERQTTLMKNRLLATSLGFPLKRKQNLPHTLTFPIQQKLLPMPHLDAHEPELDMQAYDQILASLIHMAVAMERSPQVVSQMKEEELRFLFLFMLNAIYEGKATGETFNMGGKVDILIRVEDRNIFLAECKFWKGPESVKDALDQLFSYTTWRDAKTSLLVFNNKARFSTVLAKIPEAVESHPNFLRRLPTPSFPETAFRYKFSHPKDPDREVYLTVLAFDIPGDKDR